MKLKCWVGNLDGTREGMVVSSSKKKAAEAVGTGLRDFNNYWHAAPLYLSARPNVLYTRPYGSDGAWAQGLCSK